MFCCLQGVALCSLFVGFHSEVAVRGHRQYEGSRNSSFVGRRHNDVAFRCAIKHDALGDLIPWHKLDIIFVLNVVLSRVDTTGINVTANHAAHEVGSDGLLPGLLRTAQRDLYLCHFPCRELQDVLGVEDPCEVVLLLFEFLVVQVASSAGAAFPLAGNNLVSRVFKLLDLNFLAAKHLERVGGENVLVRGRGYDNEGPLSRLIEGEESRVLI